MGVLGFTDERRRLGILECAVALGVSDFEHELRVAMEIEVSGAQTSELHATATPVRFHGGHGPAGNDDHVLDMAAGDVRADFGEARLEILVLPAVAGVSVDAETLVAITDPDDVQEVVGTQGTGATMDLVCEGDSERVGVLPEYGRLLDEPLVTFGDQIVVTT